MSSCTTTVPNSVRNSAPVGHTSRQAAWVQCLQTSEDMSQRSSPSSPSPMRSGVSCSTKATWRQVSAPSPRELSMDQPVWTSPSSGTWFHSLQATSQALQPMQMLVSVKKPFRGGGSAYPDSSAGFTGPNSLFLPTISAPLAVGCRLGTRAGSEDLGVVPADQA